MRLFGHDNHEATALTDDTSLKICYNKYNIEDCICVSLALFISMSLCKITDWCFESLLWWVDAVHVSGTARTARFSPGMMGIERQICVSVGGQVLPSTETLNEGQWKNPVSPGPERRCWAAVVSGRSYVWCWRSRRLSSSDVFPIRRTQEATESGGQREQSRTTGEHNVPALVSTWDEPDWSPAETRTVQQQRIRSSPSTIKILTEISNGTNATDRANFL